jgi:hypothetical protein
MRLDFTFFSSGVAAAAFSSGLVAARFPSGLAEIRAKYEGKEEVGAEWAHAGFLKGKERREFR